MEFIGLIFNEFKTYSQISTEIGSKIINLVIVETEEIKIYVSPNCLVFFFCVISIDM